MSTEQSSVDPELVEQTKAQIRGLVNEIAQLTKSDVELVDFYGAFLDRIVQALAAVGGAVWAPGAEGRLELKHQINLRETQLTASEENQIRHGHLLHKVFTTGEGLLVSPHSGAGDDDAAANPTDYLLVIAALKSDQQVAGVVEVFQRPGTRPTTQRGYLRFLLQMCELGGDFLKTRQLRSFTDRQTMWTQLESFTREAHASLDPRETAFTIANEGRRLVGCDRVSVAIRRGGKCYVEAISGQDTFDKRSNVVSLLGRLATAVVRTGEPMWYTGDTSDMAPQVEDAVQAYVDESHSKTVAVLPLARLPDPQANGEDKPGEPVGALIVEQIEDSRPREGMLQRVEVVQQHSSTALANAIEHHSLFLMPLWRLLGRATWLVRGRTLPKTLAVVAAVVVAAAALVVVPANFELEGNGELQPVVRKRVFCSPDGGVVKRVLVDQSQQVHEGELLLELTNVDLQVKYEEALKNVATTQKQIDSLNLLINRQPADEKEITISRIDQLASDLTGYSAQLKLYDQKIDALRITSPGDGVITTWDPKDELMRRPVKPGQVLLEVADLDKDWEVELLVSEDRMGHITRAQQQFGPDLPVTFILQSDPGVKHHGKIKEVHFNAEVRGEEGNTVRILVEIDKEDLSRRLPGAGVTAKIYCGRRSVGYVWLHDLWAFVQKRLFRLF